MSHMTNDKKGLKQIKEGCKTNVFLVGLYYVLFNSVCVCGLELWRCLKKRLVKRLLLQAPAGAYT